MCLRSIQTYRIIMGASEDEMASFDAESSFDVTEENLREKLLEACNQLRIGYNRIECGFRNRGFPKHQSQIGYCRSFVYENHFDKVLYGAELTIWPKIMRRMVKNPVYLYLNRYDAPHGAYPERRYAGHCMDLSPGIPHGSLSSDGRVLKNDCCGILRLYEERRPIHTGSLTGLLLIWKRKLL